METTKHPLHKHFKLYKPYGYLSQFESNARHQKNSKFLGSLHEFPKGIMAVGRLDKDSEGLLLLTTDGYASNEINFNNIDKEYYVQVDGEISNEALAKLEQGLDISIDGQLYRTKPCKVHRLMAEPDLPKRAKNIRDSKHGGTSWISVTITEGKFRQVRKMTSAVGYPTLRLIRVRVGKHHLTSMQPMEVIEVDDLL